MQIPKFLELIGVGYTAWFAYRFLLFKVVFSYFDLHSMQDVVLKACGWGSIFFLRSCFLTHAVCLAFALQSSRKELAETIEEIKGKISGSTGIAE